MPIPGVSQPELIPISDDLRLRRFDGNYDIALPWYQDAETLRLVDGKEDPYTPARIKRMYDYLGEHGELYWIEARTESGFRPIGDVTFWQEDMPIVIGEREYRGAWHRTPGDRDPLSPGRRPGLPGDPRGRDLRFQRGFPPLL